LIVLAFFLLPTSAANTRPIIQVNGFTISVEPETNIGQLAGGSLPAVRAGSTLDLTGDVTTIGKGSPSTLTLDGLPADVNSSFVDGNVLLVSHGAHHLEGISKKRLETPFDITVEGEGPVVSMVQQGHSGITEVYTGQRSGRKAADITIRSTQKALVKRTGAAQTGQKLVALTFDDGPGAYTQRVLDALAEAQVPATFFVLGSCAVGNEDMIDKMRAAGHEIENHSWSHPNMAKSTVDQIKREITRTSDVIGGSRYLRPPYGAYNTQVASAAAAVGHDLVLWTVDTLDWKNQNADAILAHVKADTQPGAIILMHDGGGDRSQTAAAIPAMVRWLLSNGYSLTTVSTLLQE
jgi:peptidoglycan/xylan/chitin deacetylase (PgdA/CDA1 family)